MASDQTKLDQNLREPSPAIVFYSWQSDLPNKTNRGFIEDCLKRSIKELKAEPDLRVDPALDRDTKDVPGSPDIVATIFEKIESCSLFVCDVSIINKGATGRPTPNPNVLIELGFAVKTLGWNRVICVFNEATGSISDLPFDLRQRRIRPYRLKEEDDKAETRKLLTRFLKDDLQAAFSFVENELATTVDANPVAPQPIPKIEVLDAIVECQPPIDAPTQPHVSYARKKYVEGSLIWSFTASFFLDVRPGETVTVVLHRCKGWMHDRYSGKNISLADVTIQSDPKSQITVDGTVMLARGPGQFSVQGACKTPFRYSGYPDFVKIDLHLPVSESDGSPIEANLELHQTRPLEKDWPIRWKYRDGV
jgi:hypothetical protein